MRVLNKNFFLALLALLMIIGGCTGPLNQADDSLISSKESELKAAVTEAVKLTQDEIDGILFMREEEKLAHDVYVLFYDLYNHKIFDNISKSEYSHKEAVLGLIEYYGLTDPAEGKLPGEFENDDLQDLYDLLVSMGTNVKSALEVGVIIEEKDITDIAALMEKTEVKNILKVYGNLLEGSYNHLAAFTKELDAL